MQEVLDGLVLFFAALATGALMVNWIGLSRAMLRIRSASAYIEFHQFTNETFDPYMPLVVMGSVTTTAVSFVVGSGSPWFLLAALCYAGVLVLSLLTNVRMNKQVALLSASAPPENWAKGRQVWVNFHITRTLISLPGLLFAILAVLPARGCELSLANP